MSQQNGMIQLADRVRYVERQLLRTRDLQAEQAYRLDRQRRHHIGHHGWGIVHGLALEAVDEGIAIQPGMAIDGYGRELTLRRPVLLETAVLNQDDLCGPICHKWIDVWLCADRFEAKVGDSRRWREESYIELTATPSPRTINPYHPPVLPVADRNFAPYQPFQETAPAPWPVFLGRLNPAVLFTDSDILDYPALFIPLLNPPDDPLFQHLSHQLIYIRESEIVDLHKFVCRLQEDENESLLEQFTTDAQKLIKSNAISVEELVLELNQLMDSGTILTGSNGISETVKQAQQEGTLPLEISPLLANRFLLEKLFSLTLKPLPVDQTEQLNRLVFQETPLYNSNAFDGVTLSEPVTELLHRATEEVQQPMLHRMLLQEIFSAALAECQLRYEADRDVTPPYAAFAGGTVTDPKPANQAHLLIGGERIGDRRLFAVTLAEEPDAEAEEQLPVLRDRLLLDNKGGMIIDGDLLLSPLQAELVPDDGNAYLPDLVLTDALQPDPYDPAGCRNPLGDNHAVHALGLTSPLKTPPETAVPWQMYSTDVPDPEGVNPTLRQLRLEMAHPGDKGNPANFQTVFGYTQPEAVDDDCTTRFHACLTIDANGNTTINGNLFLESGQLIDGQIDVDPNDPRFGAMVLTNWVEGQAAGASEAEIFHNTSMKVVFFFTASGFNTIAAINYTVTLFNTGQTPINNIRLYENIIATSFSAPTREITPTSGPIALPVGAESPTAVNLANRPDIAVGQPTEVTVIVTAVGEAFGYFPRAMQQRKVTIGITS